MKIPHDNRSLLFLNDADYLGFVDRFFERELLADGKDITTSVLFDQESQNLCAQIIAKEQGILAGREEAEFLLNKYCIQQKWFFEDGALIDKNDLILELVCDFKVLLKMERVILNFLSRLSGIATVTRKIIDQLPQELKIAATRKTLWGLLDKKAVVVGGGLTHRLNLEDALLIKENHLIVMKKLLEEKKSNCSNDVNSAIKAVLDKIDANSKSKYGFWEIEVETAEEFFVVINNLPLKRPGVIMFDNFAPKDIANLLKKVKKPHGIFFEASGGINPNNFKDFVNIGVDVISCGFLTKNAQSLDLSMRIK